MLAKLGSPAANRNRGPILAVLARVLPSEGTVLEIASGSGQHVVFFADALPALRFVPSDPDPSARDSIEAYRAEAGLANVEAALALDVRETPWPISTCDAVVAINMVHISPWEATLALLDGAAARLPAGGPLVLYGPYRVGGVHTAESNARFDEGLRARDPAWGVRDLEAVLAAAAERGLVESERVAMPANNLTVVLRRG
ncbi:MAG: DUF938 domain-containing protein [Myxococcales bacterium]|nr:DUF938 domain-containing protein [Myxococcales bacterium]